MQQPVVGRLPEWVLARGLVNCGGRADLRWWDAIGSIPGQSTILASRRRSCRRCRSSSCSWGRTSLRTSGCLGLNDAKNWPKFGINVVNLSSEAEGVGIRICVSHPGCTAILSFKYKKGIFSGVLRGVNPPRPEKRGYGKSIDQGTLDVGRVF